MCNKWTVSVFTILMYLYRFSTYNIVNTDSDTYIVIFYNTIWMYIYIVQSSAVHVICKGDEGVDVHNMKFSYVDRQN